MSVAMDSKELRLIVGRNLRARRIELGLSQEEVAKMIGHCQVYVSQLERGERVVDTDLLVAFAEALQTSYLALLSPDPVFSSNRG